MCPGFAESNGQLARGQWLNVCDDRPSVAMLLTLNNPQALDLWTIWRPVYWFHKHMTHGSKGNQQCSVNCVPEHIEQSEHSAPKQGKWCCPPSGLNSVCRWSLLSLYLRVKNWVNIMPFLTVAKLSTLKKQSVVDQPCTYLSRRTSACVVPP